MADIIVSPIIQLLFDKLTSAAVKKVARSKGIHQELKKWETSLSQIRGVLNDAADKEITDEHVKLWLDDLHHLAYDIDDLLDDLATKAMHRQFIEESGAITSKVRNLIPTYCTNFSLSTKMSDKLDDITTKFKNLEEQKTSLGLIKKDKKSKKMDRGSETSLVRSIIGREGDKKALLQKLLGDEPSNQNFSIVPIVGLGGVGKTALTRILYDDTKVNNHFELKAWVCVSDEFDIFKISKIILQSVTGKYEEFADLNLLQVALREKLSGKRFLLVLDDVWSESYEDWERLTCPFLLGASGSKIIMTTRKQQLLKKLGYDQPHDLKFLEHDDALSLFCQNALGENNFDSHQTLKPHGEGIVEKCNGLPLALIALGRSLMTKTNEEEWKEVLKSEIWRLQDENTIIPALRLSYQDLPPHLKQLFAYCSLFPKDDVFDKEELILLWMAEGFLHESAPRMSTESLGRKYFNELLSRSFFQLAPGEESLYVMHDLMNDLATFVAGEFYFRLDYETGVDVKKNALEKHRHLSFVSQEYEVYQKFKVIEKAKSLRTLLALSVGEKQSWERFYLSNKVLAELLPQLPLLRVLSLSGYEISEVPESIGTLKHLRYLNLSRTEITHIPEQVGNLYNLQTLLVCGCHELETLPKSFVKLKNLRHLDMSDTPRLRKTPLGIGKLRSLQTLSKVVVEGGNGFAITDLKDLNDIHGRLTIKGLSKVQNAMDAKNANLLEKEWDDLKMEWSDVFDGARNETLEKEVLNMLKPRNDKLKKLGIVSYGGIDFPSWVGDPSFLRLTRLKIRGCKNCTSLPPFGQLPLLKELVVEGMDGVKVVGSELLGNGNAFPSLEILSFEKMEGWEVWSTINGDTATSFPRLQKLYIKACHRLVEASLEAIPSLRVLETKGCGVGVLRSVVHAASSITKLVIDRISGLTQLDEGIIEHLGAVEEVTIWGCDEMRYLWESEAEACKTLVNLRKLEVENCDNLVGLGEKEEDNCESCLTSLRQVDISYCKSLKHYSCPNDIEMLRISSCGSITSVSFPRGGQKKLKRLWIWSCDNLVGLGEKEEDNCESCLTSLRQVRIGVCKSLKHYSCPNDIEMLSICHCGSITSVSFPRGGQKKLKSLRIFDCDNLVGLGEKEEDNCESCLTSLRQVDIQHCKSLKRYSCPNDTETLDIRSCDSLTSVSFPRGGQKKLKRLNISDCEKLLEEEEEEEGSGGGEKSRVLLNKSMSLLEDVKIENWSNLKSFPDLGCFVHLNSLVIRNCKNLESFPDEELSKLTSLTNIGIWDCERMDDSFPRGNWPPNLSRLIIGGFKKPITEWGPQNFPSSLVWLHLYVTSSASEEDITSGSQLSHILPSSLKTLWIDGFKKLESVSMGLQHLTSLQHLDIWRCPILRDLPETLLPSLLALRILECPKVKERCSSRRGSYWPLISHIPFVEIDFKLCN